MTNLQDTIIKGLSRLAISSNTLLEGRESKTIPNHRATFSQLLDTIALFVCDICKELSYKLKAYALPIGLTKD